MASTDSRTLTGFLENPDTEEGVRVEQKELVYKQKRSGPQERHQKVPIKVVYIRRKKDREDVRGKKLTTDDFFVETDYTDAKMCSLFREHDVGHFVVLHFDLSTPPHVVSAVLRSGFKVTVGKGQRRHYVFFGHSASQLRERTCILYDQGVLGPWERLVNGFGEFEAIKNPSKRAARIGLLLSTATKCLELDEKEIDHTSDIERDGFTFTDGCGFISVACARKIMQDKDISERYRHQDPPVPSVIQFRMKGCKGVVMTDPSLPNGVCIRPSQEKFKWKLPPPHVFGVCDDGISQPYTFGQLNKQYIMMLSALGIKDEVFLSKQETYFKELDRLETDKEVAFRHLCARGYIGLAERLFSREGGPDNETLEILRGFRSRVRRPPKANKLHKLLNTKPEPARALKIPIEKSRNVFGVCDPSGTLEPGQCFFQATVRGKMQVFADTKVAVVKCPCYHPGDFRVLQCVNVEECRHLVDCVVFPVQGERPHADEIAGSDLDGDKFFVCWDPDLVPECEEAPLSYPGGEAAKKERVSIGDLISVFANYNSRTVSRLNELFNRWADVKGVTSSECRKIAKLFSTAVDTAKTGKGVDIPPRLLKPPDAQEKRYVWQKMLERANLYLADSVAADSDLTVRVFEEADITDLLNNKDINVSEYQLFRFLYKWCESNGRLQDLQRYVGQIDFTRFTPSQKVRVAVDCPELPMEYVSNAFYRSKILTENDIERMDIMSPNQWSLFYRESDEDISWPTVRSVLTSETPKLLIFEFCLAGTVLVMGLCLPGPLVMEDVITTDQSSGRPTVVFFSDHSGGGMEMVDLQDGHRNDDYLLELDSEHLQIYNVRRPRTFVWLRWSDEAVRMSVALDRFPGERRDRSVKLQKEEVQSVEVFYQVTRMQCGPSIYTERRQREGLSEEPPQAAPEGTDVAGTAFNLNIGSPREFPELGVELDEDISEEAERLRKFESMCEAICEDGEAGTLSSDSLNQIIHRFGQLPEAALRLESLMWKYRDQVNHRPEAEERYFHLLINIVFMTSYMCVQPAASTDTESTLMRIRRFCKTLQRDGVVFGLDRLRQLFIHLQYAGVHCANSLLDMIRDGVLPINPADFVPGHVDYYLHWSALCTMEVREEVCSSRSRALRAREDEISVIRVEEDDGRYFIADWEKNELPLSVGDQLQITALPMSQASPEVIVTEVKIDRTEVELKVLWNNGEAQHQCITPGQFAAVHIGNCISHRRVMAALDCLCVKADSDTPSNLMCERVISSFGGNVDGLAATFEQGGDEDRMRDDGIQSDAEAPPKAPGTTDATSTGPTNDEDLHTDAPLEHQRTEAAFGGSDFDAATGMRPKKRWFTKSMMNSSQEKAVQAASSSEITLIQGPPGTGKTKAAAEVIIRWQGQSDNKILAVAETNEGVDNIIQKLLDRNVPQEQILRVGQPEKVRYGLRHLTLDKRYDDKYGSGESRGGRKKPQGIKAILSKANIICTTCIGAGSQVLQQMTFRRVLVDEAAQATEPAVLCALSHGCQQVCLIGDDQQLPPLVQSEDAQELKISLFERWRGQRLQVHLLDTQYRMHPAMSAFPSQHFYNGQIKDGVEASARRPPSGFDWPNQNMPVSFVNVSSRETSRGTSKFNDEEVKIVIAMTEQLLEGGDIREDDIGIVSPYKAQIKKVTEGLDQNIAVRSVDGFQGQERDVIIFSAVRANEGGYVGFLNDPRRMNVLLTRAKRGLIVVGDGKTLEKGSDDWNKWIQWIRENKLEQLRAEGTGTGRGRQSGTNRTRGRGQRGRGYRGRGAGRARRGRGNGWHQSQS
ncbi:uncharacterized protein LOC118414200 [Branchiostoma floridae]|uniref:Uncharacterized protein LOC118414200 n=1 Tax=Branchiostoma floridae TaxID=7739 RepID=A0A9J7L0N9_BRAFL|nr:uncharacterized protein LOC118414200 [Branchiostoma floridae]